MAAYYLVLGLLIALTQMNVKWIEKEFMFLKYYWGKFLLCTFLASISFSKQSFDPEDIQFT